MKIAILGGTGSLGTGLARRWIKAGHEIIIGSRSKDSALKATQALDLPDANACLNEEAARIGDIACLTVPFAHQVSTLETVKEELRYKILVDATVPLVPPKVMRVQLPAGDGCAAMIAQRILGEEVSVVSAFQNISAELLQSSHPINCDVLVCGDRREDRETVISLISDMGLKGWHAGPLCNSAAAEALTSVLIAINKNHAISHSGIAVTGV
ncbi:MAG: NADPH-dependent F420 reductase [Gammaproteobacteria bacterium]